MKVFISHSTKDKWAARRISQDLASLGVESFLDEKDIETGEAIDDSIQNHLSECEDFLIVLSPASVGSHWVLVELGGAIALGKRLIPILLYIGTNEIPKPIAKHLARDINEIDRYYDELKKRITHPVPKTKPIVKKRKPTRKRAEQRLKVGDIVILPLAAQQDVYKGNFLIDWNNDMDAYLGQRGKVIQIEPYGGIRLDIDEEWVWAPEWLSKVTKS